MYMYFWVVSTKVIRWTRGLVAQPGGPTLRFALHAVFLIIYAKRSCVEQLPASDSVVGRAYTA